ncbi:unnamed protein product, partial [Ectocarpus sp. 8 AP-2014]
EVVLRWRVCVDTIKNTNEHAYPVAIHSIPTGRDVGLRRRRMLSRLCHGQSYKERLAISYQLRVSKRHWLRRTSDEKQQQFVT